MWSYRETQTHRIYRNTFVVVPVFLVICLWGTQHKELQMYAGTVRLTFLNLTIQSWGLVVVIAHIDPHKLCSFCTYAAAYLWSQICYFHWSKNWIASWISITILSKIWWRTTLVLEKLISQVSRVLWVVFCHIFEMFHSPQVSNFSNVFGIQIPLKNFRAEFNTNV